MRKEIFITGMGAVTPIGVGVPSYWAALLAGKCGICSNKDPEGLPVERAALVRDFNPRDFMPKPLVLDMEPYAQYAYAAAQEAVDQSGLAAAGERVGVVMATALQGIAMLCAGAAPGPKLLTKYMGNIVASQFAIRHGICGPSLTVSTACSSGGDAILLAASLIESGAADAMVVLAGEAAVCPAVIRSLGLIRALSPLGESRPFDRSRSGFVMGEGGGALVLESADHARARGAEPLARLLGCANNNDAFHPVAPRPDGAGAARCIADALKDAGVSPAQVDYINAHGTATQKGDVAETCAIRTVFGDRPVPVSSTKGATGHMMGAGGVTEVIACVQAVRTGLCPPNLGLTEPDPACALNLVTAENRPERVSVALSNAMGFGGQNSCVVVGAL